MPLRWSPGPWKYLNGAIYQGPLPHEQIIAMVHGRTPEKADANGRLMAGAPEAARLLALLYPGAPVPVQEQIHAWFSKLRVTQQDLGSSGPPHGET